MDPRANLILILASPVLLLVGTNPLGLAIGVVFVATLYIIARIPPRMIWRSIKPLFFILLFTSGLNLLFVRDGTVLFSG